MRKPIHHLTRRTVVGSLAGLGAAAALPAFAQGPGAGPILKKAIPKTGEQIPAIGLGTWITFNVGGDAGLLAKRTQVLQTFFDRGGALIDSSPMYGSSEATVGYGLARVKNKGALFSASKVWTIFGPMGAGQMEASRKYWGIERFNLMQIHNILNWSAHIETLKAMKAEGRVRYIGITTSQGWRHGDFEAIMRKEPIDFVHFTYNVIDRKAEQRLLPLAAERGLAVIVNRPFQEGVLIERMKNHALPPWAREIDCANWAQFLLKFIVSHPAVTCAIPATRRVDHMEENMGALRGRLPDAKMRARMARYAENL